MCASVPQSCREIFSLIAELSRALRCCQQEESFCLDLTLSQFFILHAIVEKGQTPLARLHDLLAVEKSTTTRMLAPVIRRGLIVQERSENDSRAMNLRLTPQGEEIYKRIWVCLEEFLTAIQKEIPAARKKAIYGATLSFLEAVKKASKARRNRKKLVKGEPSGCCKTRPQR